MVNISKALPLAFALGAALVSAQAQHEQQVVDSTPTVTVTPPDYNDKIATARWMTETLTWGVLSTISTRSYA